MAKARVHNFVVSLDGFATGEDQSLSAGFGTAQEEFAKIFGTARIWRGMQPGSFGPDEAIADAWGAGIGAEIMGRNKYRPVKGPWPDDGWPGWWGPHPPFHTPCFVMTHFPREPLVMEGGTTFYFVDASPEDVLAMAFKAADGLDVRIGGGPTTLNAFLKADLVDYLHVMIAPIILGRGVPLWTGLEGMHKRFKTTSVSLPSGVTHLFFEKR